MISVCVAGGLGRMGSKVVDAIKSTEDIELVAIVEKEERESGIRVVTDIKEVIDSVDIIVEFTTPEATVYHTNVSAEYGKAMVIGTTGFTPEQLQKIKDASSKIPIFLSPNMSWGANVMIEVARILADVLDGYDMEVVEFHHRFKKDAPSGTAKSLIEKINKKGMDVVYGRKGFSPRKDNEIGVHSIRGGSVVGEHRLILSGMGERVELFHIVWDRMAFAHGTIKAIRFISGKSRGMYGMEDIFKGVET